MGATRKYVVIDPAAGKIDRRIFSEQAIYDDIVINQSHPHWSQLMDSQDILNYLRHCAYDGLSEWKARQKASRIDPDTIRILKDGFLRLPMQIEEHQSDEADTSQAAAQ